MKQQPAQKLGIKVSRFGRHLLEVAGDLLDVAHGGRGHEDRQLALLGGGSSGPVPSSQVSQSATGQSNLNSSTKHFTLQVLASTEDTWGKLLQPRGVQYTPAKLVFYSEYNQSGCGAG